MSKNMRMRLDTGIGLVSCRMLSDLREGERAANQKGPRSECSIGTGSPVARVGISHQKTRDLPLRSLGIPMGSNGILACKSFRYRDHVKKKIV